MILSQNSLLTVNYRDYDYHNNSIVTLMNSTLNNWLIMLTVLNPLEELKKMNIEELKDKVVIELWNGKEHIDVPEFVDLVTPLPESISTWTGILQQIEKSSKDFIKVQVAYIEYSNEDDAVLKISSFAVER